MASEVFGALFGFHRSKRVVPGRNMVLQGTGCERELDSVIGL